MGFFNKKEEVIQLKLTQYGKYRLSKGKLNPRYYAFFDDNVLYDSSHASYDEAQNSIEPRIQEETPSSRVQHNFAGVETNIKKLTTSRNPLKFYEADLPYPQNTDDKHYALACPPLGTSNSTETLPSTTIKFLTNEMSKSAYYATGAHQVIATPQIDIEINYETSILYNEEGESATDGSSEVRPGIKLGSVYADGTEIQVKEDHLLLEIFESDVPFSNKNFDIEIYAVEEEEGNGFRTPSAASTGKKEILVPLSFVRQREEIKDNLLLDDPKEYSAENVDLDSSYVGHYFDIYADSEIDPRVFCSIGISDSLEDVYDDFEFDPEDCPKATATSEGGLSNVTYDEECS